MTVGDWEVDDEGLWWFVAAEKKRRVARDPASSNSPAVCMNAAVEVGGRRGWCCGCQRWWRRQLGRSSKGACGDGGQGAWRESSVVAIA